MELQMMKHQQGLLSQKQNSFKFPKKLSSCKVSRFVLKLKVFRVQLNSVYSSKFTIFRWMEPKQRTFIILPTLMKTHVKCVFSANQDEKRKNEAWKTWKGVCGQVRILKHSFSDKVLVDIGRENALCNVIV